MRRKVHVRFGGGPLEKGSGNGPPRRWPTQPLKRAAVKFGLGRYLYRLPQQWVDYDSHKKQITRPPSLPAWALPQKVDAPVGHDEPPAAPVREKKVAAAKAPGNLPANGVELQRRLYEYDAKLAKQNICAQGDLVRHVVDAGVRAGYDADLATWEGEAMLLAAEVTKSFEARARSGQKKPREVA